MNIHIENEEACRLAGDLAELTGESVTGAVTVALRERLAREKRRRDVRARAEDLLAIGERCAKPYFTRRGFASRYKSLDYRYHVDGEMPK